MDKVKYYWREPLVQFLVIGLMIFSIDRFVYPASDDQRFIRVDESVENKLTSLFKEGKGRKPNDKELDQLIHRWLQNEMLYREALALGLDKGDEMIRDRLILKMRNVVFNNIIVDAVSEDELRQWFEDNRSRYDRPLSYDFAQFHIAGADDRKLAEGVVSEMIGGVVPEEYADLVRIYKRRSRNSIAHTFGEAFATRIVKQQPGKWRGLPSDKGWRIAKVKAIHDATPASFEALKNRIEADWRKEQERKMVFETYKEIRERYDIGNGA